MRNPFKKQPEQRLINQALTSWLEDLDSLLLLIEQDVAQLMQEIADLTDYVEDNLA